MPLSLHRNALKALLQRCTVVIALLE